ncbi:NAD(P)/FAD-dependent oxidoreductase [Algivirga pacifica]|uniref:NAD(P)/FAD-dependent oxidoreductase n=1 Tax=Algivirga pacifica TaxID=1162670 RepID=A0ABP9DE26_9BACT
MKTYDCAIIGGGIAGLSLSIQLAQKGYEVVLLEKKRYPFHRVCGEYVSMETWDFIESLGVSLTHEQLPKIERLQLTTPKGKSLQAPLPLGGFGISRYRLDHLLFQQAKNVGVEVLEGHGVNHVKRLHCDIFEVKSGTTTLQARVTVGAFGKQSNLDQALQRKHKMKHRYSDFIGVKYHVEADLPEDLIGLHNFKEGYCGISKIEDHRYCMCYLTTATNLKKAGGSIHRMEQEILSENPYLRQFLGFKRLYEKPLAISQIDFSSKELFHKDIIMIGDAAGLIAPLSGNGMSMAFRSSNMLASLLERYFQDQMSWEVLKQLYAKQWKNEFGSRLKTGRILQGILKNTRWAYRTLELLTLFPWLTRQIILRTHGKPFL